MWCLDRSTLMIVTATVILTAITTQTSGHSSSSPLDWQQPSIQGDPSTMAETSTTDTTVLSGVLLPCEGAWPGTITGSSTMGSDSSRRRGTFTSSSRSTPLTVGDICHPPNPMSWPDAHEYCRGFGGFLSDQQDLNEIKQLWRITSNELWTKQFQKNAPSDHLWTALTNHKGYFHWLSQQPVSGKFLRWSGTPPTLWERRCGALNLSLSEEQQPAAASHYLPTFTLTPCHEQLPFFCRLVNESTGSDVSDIDLVLSTNMQHLEHHSWLQVPQDDFTKLQLSCTAVRRSTGEPLRSQPHLFWLK
ncbi:unnamed protein product, partial [Meganyctiphanes norvegica]